ncbi:MAG: sensor histidine kinase [Hyphomonadaceae bacterium]|nr:sensor histidine kinase [Hyphomonadaceae bacterium]
MAKAPARKSRRKKRSSGVIRSRIARLIFASNLAGLAILIVGAMVLNEMRAGLVMSKKTDLEGQAQIFTNLLGGGATLGRPEPMMDADLARATIRELQLPATVRAQVRTTDGEMVADSFLLSDRVDISTLPPIREPGTFSRWSADLSSWASDFMARLLRERPGASVRTQSFEEEYNAALMGDMASSQRFSDRGQRVISVSVPVQRVSAVVGVLTLEASGVDEIVRAERAALLPFILVAVLVALITSALMTLGIARPLRRLSLAADRVRSGSSESLDLPNLTKRPDEIGDLAGALEAMTIALVERIEANERFAADVAHELKNPLTSIRSAVETAERVKDDPEAREKLRQLIAKDVQRLDRLITDISNASRLEAEVTRVPTAKLDITRLCEDIVDTYTALGMDTSVKVQFVDETKGAGLLVRGREGPLGQVLRNLIDNARSFSPPEGLVRVTLIQDRQGRQTTARILVEDEGPGIPPDKLSTIFDRFYTDRPAGAAFGNNSGLGLSIVAQIVETHQGTVFAENREQGGARFVVEIPAA